MWKEVLKKEDLGSLRVLYREMSKDSQGRKELQNYIEEVISRSAYDFFLRKEGNYSKIHFLEEVPEDMEIFLKKRIENYAKNPLNNFLPPHQMVSNPLPVFYSYPSDAKELLELLEENYNPELNAPENLKAFMSDLENKTDLPI